MTGADEHLVARLKVSEVQGCVKDGSDGVQLSGNPALGLKTVAPELGGVSSGLILCV